MIKDNTTHRIIYFDLLRIFSIFCMIVLHVSASQYFTQPVASFNWQVFNIYNGFVRFCVPIFVMISGSFFLDPNKNFSIKKLFHKNILRIMIALIFWSIIYSVFTTMIQYDNLNLQTVKFFIVNTITGHYHMWFLFTLLGLYLCIPFLRKIVVDKKLTEYFLLLSLIFSIILPFLEELPHFSLIKVLSEKANLFFILGYVGYFVAGFYFTHTNLAPRIKSISYALGLFGVILSICLTSYTSVLKGEVTYLLYAYLTPTSCATSLSVFLLFKNKIGNLKFSQIQSQIILLLSKCSFGIYLVHAFFIWFYEQIGFTTTLFNPIISVPIISIVIFISSFIVIYFMSKIPVVNKYLI